MGGGDIYQTQELGENKVIANVHKQRREKLLHVPENSDGVCDLQWDRSLSEG